MLGKVILKEFLSSLVSNVKVSLSCNIVIIEDKYYYSVSTGKIIIMSDGNRVVQSGKGILNLLKPLELNISYDQVYELIKNIGISKGLGSGIYLSQDDITFLNNFSDSLVGKDSFKSDESKPNLASGTDFGGPSAPDDILNYASAPDDVIDYDRKYDYEGVQLLVTDNKSFEIRYGGSLIYYTFDLDLAIMVKKDFESTVSRYRIRK